MGYVWQVSHLSSHDNYRENLFTSFAFSKRNGLESNTLRFLARIQTNDPIQADRRFIISYFLSDDSIHVHEPPVKNSGINGGRFLERMKIKKPNQPPYSTKLPEYYSYKDLYVGAVLVLNNFYLNSSTPMNIASSSWRKTLTCSNILTLTAFLEKCNQCYKVTRLTI